MPNFTDISSIPLDKFQMQKNPKPKQDPTNNKFFFYLDFPAQGYPVKFNPMLYDSIGKPQNILNFAVTSSINNKPYPMVYFSSNGKFQMADLQSFIPVGIQVTQKIHDTNVIGKSTSKDLQMIFECNQVGGSGVLFLHILLTTSTETNGDDFNKIFENLTDLEQLEKNTKNFDTLNQKPPPFKYNFMSGISNQFGLDTTDPIKNSMKSFYFLDENKNKHILLQTPIPINSENFTKIQNFYENFGLAINPFTIYSTSKLVPDQAVPITNDVLVGTMDSLKDAQTTPPQTIEDYNNQQIKDKKDAQTQKNVDKAEKANKEGFLGSFFGISEKEGLKTMNCRVANSSKKLVATLVGDETSLSSALDGYTLIITISCFIGIIGLVVYLVKKYTFSGFKPKKDNEINLKELYEFIRGKNSKIFWCNMGIFLIGFALVIIMIVISSTTKNISKSSSFFCIVLGILLISVSITIRGSIQLFNMKTTRNRYPFAYSFIQNHLEKFITQTDMKEIEENIGNDDNPNKDAKTKFFILLHQCMSAYFGDKDWYADKSKSDSNSKIVDVNLTDNTITVKLRDNRIVPDYNNVDNIKLKL
jgi:hypothetical protein